MARQPAATSTVVPACEASGCAVVAGPEACAAETALSAGVAVPLGAVSGPGVAGGGARVADMSRLPG
jgi:hypothetical protein